MELFAELRAVTEAAQREQDLPDPLASKIFAIIDNPAPFRGREEEIRDLIGQVSDYDTYGQTGYIGMGVNNTILEGTLKRLWATTEDNPTEKGHANPSSPTPGCSVKKSRSGVEGSRSA